MTPKFRPYQFDDTAVSICSTFLRRVDAKIVLQDGCVWMLKRYPKHGAERVLIADDIDYYRRAREIFVKTPEQVRHYNTSVRYGCPYASVVCVPLALTARINSALSSNGSSDSNPRARSTRAQNSRFCAW